MLNEVERLGRAVDSIVGIIFFDLSGTVIGSNEVFRQVTGYTEEEIQSRTLHWRMMTPPEWVAASEQQIKQLVHTGFIGPYEKEYFMKDGSRRWMMFTGKKLDDNTIVELCVDITGRKQAELAAQRSEEHRKKLIADLANALNNPLQAAMYALSLLQDDIRGKPSAKALEDSIKEIHALSHRLMYMASGDADEDHAKETRRKTR
jgi:PAS domain S-box-containing protein